MLKSSRIFPFIKENKAILIIMSLLMIERIYILLVLGPQYTLGSDDQSYVISGIEFAKTGSITYCGEITAQIMPAMTIFIGLLSMVFGTGTMLWLVLKLCWITMGVFTAYFIYKCVILFAPKWCGIFASLFLLLPNFVWMDNLLLTETPFIFLVTATIYFTLKMGTTGKWKYFWWCTVTYILAFMLKANFAPYPIFVLIYLLFLKYDCKKLIKQCIVLACAVLCVIIPWSIRNYIRFEQFIPLTYGAGNPMLLGSYEGAHSPSDDALDYETNVNQVLKDTYPQYYNEDGTVKKDYYASFLSLKKDEIKAKYRISVWAQEQPLDMAKTYLIHRPDSLMHDVFYWKDIFGVPAETLLSIRKWDFLLCVIGLLSSFVLRKRRKIMSFLALVYLANVYIYSFTSFAFSRYAESFISLRYIILGISVYLILLAIMEIVRNVKEYERHDSMKELN